MFYDRDHSGTYLIDEFKRSNLSDIPCNKNQSLLKLETNHTFVLRINDTIRLKGDWKYYDTGDRSIIQLQDHQCSFGVKHERGFIKVPNPQLILNNDSIAILSFISTEKEIRNNNRSTDDLFINLGIVIIGILIILLLMPVIKKIPW